jgi:type I restriction enzyme S subunit
MMKNNITYRQTSIGLLPTDWEVKKLGDIGRAISGLTYSPDDVKEKGGLLVLRSSNIKHRQLIFNDNVFVDVKTDEFYPVQENDILICVRNGSKSLIGKNALITKDAVGFAFGAFMAIYRSEFNNYLFQVFDTDIYYKEIHKNLGATINSINGSDLRLFKIPFPTLPEQNKIATILSTWDQAINKITKILLELRNQKNGLAIELLSGRIKFAIDSNNEIIKTKGFIIPKNWRIVPLSKLVKQIKNPITPEKEISYKQIGIRSHAKGIFHKEEVSGLSLGNKSVFKIEPDCFIVNIVFAWEHAIAKTTANEIGMIASHRFPMYKPIKEELDLDYLLHFFKSKKGKDLLGLASPGGAGRNKTLGQSEFLKLQIPVPGIDEQRKIAACLDKVDEEILLYEKKLSELKVQKKGLMQQLLTGKIRVK